MDDKIYVYSFEKYNGHFAFRISYNYHNSPTLSSEDNSVVQEFLSKSTGIEDNRQWLKDGGAIEVIITKNGAFAEYRIEQI